MTTLTEQFEEILQEIITDEDNGEHNVEYFKSDYINRLLQAVKERDMYCVGNDDNSETQGIGDLEQDAYNFAKEEIRMRMEESL